MNNQLTDTIQAIGKALEGLNIAQLEITKQNKDSIEVAFRIVFDKEKQSDPKAELTSDALTDEINWEQLYTYATSGVVKNAISKLAEHPNIITNSDLLDKLNTGKLASELGLGTKTIECIKNYLVDLKIYHG